MISRETVLAEQSLLFFASYTLEGRKLQVYVMLKILKLLLKTRSKVTSYILKFAVDQALLNMKPTKGELSFCTKKVLKYQTLRDKFLFDDVNLELKKIGVKEIVIKQGGLKFVGRKRKCDIM